jgi:tRNA (guanosine-2'-O-)-methyltransferase
MRRRSTGVRRVDELFGLRADLERAVDTETAIRILEPLVTDDRRERLRQVIAERLDSVTVLMDAPHDPHNGAAVVRSCDAFGIQRLHVVERYEPFLVASSVARGSEKWVDVVRHESAAAAGAALRERGHELVATDPDGDLLPEDLRELKRPALVIGNEREGIAADLRALCTRAVRVPMRGFTDSLNLSVCTAILLAAAVSDRPGDLPEIECQRLYARGLYLTTPRAGEALLAGPRPVTPQAFYTTVHAAGGHERNGQSKQQHIARRQRDPG